MGEETDIFSMESSCNALPQPQPSGHLREIETTSCNQRIHHSIYDGDHDNNQDGIHSLQMKWRWTVTIVSKVTLISESNLNIFSYLHLIWLNFNNSLKNKREKSH